MTAPLFCSYYTNDFYKRLAEGTLIPSLEKFRLPFCVERVPDLGAWHLNTKRKAGYLSRKLEENPTRDIVWIDADAEILEYPTLLVSMPEHVSMAAHVWPHRWDDVPELWTSVLLVRRAAGPLLSLWARENAIDTSEKWSDPNLLKVLGLEPRFGFYTLPAEYAWVEYMMRSRMGPEVRPVIRHARVSRTMWEAKP